VGASIFILLPDSLFAPASSLFFFPLHLIDLVALAFFDGESRRGGARAWRSTA